MRPSIYWDNYPQLQKLPQTPMYLNCVNWRVPKLCTSMTCSRGFLPSFLHLGNKRKILNKTSPGDPFDSIVLDRNMLLSGSNMLHATNAHETRLQQFLHKTVFHETYGFIHSYSSQRNTRINGGCANPISRTTSHEHIWKCEYFHLDHNLIFIRYKDISLHQ